MKYSRVDKPSGNWQELINNLASEFVIEMEDSPNRTLELMRHYDENVRAGAVCAGYAFWSMNRDLDYSRRCCEIAGTDTEDLPRVAAVSMLCRIYANSRNPDIRQVIQQVAREKLASEFLRKCASLGIVELECGMSVELNHDWEVYVRNFLNRLPQLPSTIDSLAIRAALQIEFAEAEIASLRKSLEG